MAKGGPVDRQRRGLKRGFRPYRQCALCAHCYGMERWEYMTFDFKKPNRDVAEGLARLGADGWEAVAMVSSWGVGWSFVHPIVLLKRPLPG